MKIINVRELRSTIPHLSEALAQEQELVLVSHGAPIARILPIDAPPQKVESLAWLRKMAPSQKVDSTELIRLDRDRRGT